MTGGGVPFAEVVIDASKILDWQTFHAVFIKAFGFPDVYGSNMNAWIDCMTDLNAPGSGLTTIHAPPNGIVLLRILNAKDFSKRCPEQATALSEGAAFVNWRRCELGGAPVLALSYHQ